MKACAVLFLLLPILAVANTAYIAICILWGIYKTPLFKLDNLIEGIKKLHSEIFFLPEFHCLLPWQTIANALTATVDSCYADIVPGKSRLKPKNDMSNKCRVTMIAPSILNGSNFGKQGNSSRPERASDL